MQSNKFFSLDTDESPAGQKLCDVPGENMRNVRADESNATCVRRIHGTIGV
jgi:hypothetical protein